MIKRANPLIPLGLFRVRAFAMINLSTLLIYGALYVTFGFQSLFLQGTLGYAAFAAGAVGLPTGLMLTFLSTRIGSLAGRLGGRRFLTPVRWSWPPACSGSPGSRRPARPGRAGRFRPPTTGSTCSPGSSCSGSGSAWSWRR
jgi:hypothetical protein